MDEEPKVNRRSMGEPHESLDTQGLDAILLEFRNAFHNGSPLSLNWLVSSLSRGVALPTDEYRRQ